MGRPPEDQTEELKNWLRGKLVPVMVPGFLPEEGDPLDLIQTEDTERRIKEKGIFEGLLEATKADREKK